MNRTLLGTFVVLLVSTNFSSAQEDTKVLVKTIDLGSLGQFFELVDAVTDGGPKRVVPIPVRPGEAPPAFRLILRLKAKKDVDTSELKFKIGSFDKADTLLRAVPLHFGDGFPLLRGESITLACDVLHPPQFQGKIVIGETVKPMPKGEKSVPEKK
jgi:hypothetical protein